MTYEVISKDGQLGNRICAEKIFFIKLESSTHLHLRSLFCFKIKSSP